MQLFITDDFSTKNNDIVITEKRIIDQLRKVLRAKSGYTFFLQNKTGKITKRHKCEVIEIKDKVFAKILETEEKNTDNFPTKGVITAILNKFDKMELIVQKLTEIGLKKIYFVPTERSKFKTIKDNKLERFYKIALEAAEQSWSWYIPEIKILSNFQIEGNIAVLNFDGEYYKNTDLTNIDFLLIGPEGGLTEKDLQQIKAEKKISLGSKILRAETAAIVGGFIIN